MKIGVCTGTDKLALLAELGYDYFEPNFSWLASLDEATYREQTALVEKHGLPAESYNIFFRGGMKLYAKDGGQDELLKEIEAFATHGFARAAAWGGKLAVIGSGFARGIPADMTREEVEPQFARVLAVCGEAAERYGMRVAVEPLCSQECRHFHPQNTIGKINENAVLFINLHGFVSFNGILTLCFFCIVHHAATFCQGISILLTVRFSFTDFCESI